RRNGLGNIPFFYFSIAISFGVSLFWLYVTFGSDFRQFLFFQSPSSRPERTGFIFVFFRRFRSFPKDNLFCFSFLLLGAFLNFFLWGCSSFYRLFLYLIRTFGDGNVFLDPGFSGWWCRSGFDLFRFLGSFCNVLPFEFWLLSLWGRCWSWGLSLGSNGFWSCQFYF